MEVGNDIGEFLIDIRRKSLDGMMAGRPSGSPVPNDAVPVRRRVVEDHTPRYPLPW